MTVLVRFALPTCSKLRFAIEIGPRHCEHSRTFASVGSQLLG